MPSACFFCGGKIHKYGKRKRHVIKQGKVWHYVQRYYCNKCGKTRTLLCVNMLPYKHYEALEIEQVLQKQEDPTEPPHECGAEESTLYRWKCEFPSKLNALAASLEQLAHTFEIVLAQPLKRVYNALASLAQPPPNCSRLAWAFYMKQANPVHLG
jgi:transposase-like protein